MKIFEGFTTETVDVGEAALHVRCGGTGSPVLLLHGHPRTGATWHRVAARLRDAGHTVVVPDLRGYRAGLGIDRAHEEADRAAGRRVTCPLLVLWSSRDNLEDLHGDPLAVWREWSIDLRGGGPIDPGHHMAEEAPDELAAALLAFLRA